MCSARYAVQYLFHVTKHNYRGRNPPILNPFMRIKTVTKKISVITKLLYGAGKTVYVKYRQVTRVLLTTGHSVNKSQP